MATQIRQLAQYEGGLVTINLEWDDATNRISGVRVINNGAALVYAALVRTNDRRLYENTFPSGETFIPIPTSGANRIDIIDLGQGKFSGVEIQLRYPA